MKKCFKILLVLLLASIIGLFFLYRYLECNPIFLGGGPSGPVSYTHLPRIYRETEDALKVLVGSAQILDWD